jgi:hypothetical protein
LQAQASFLYVRPVTLKAAAHQDRPDVADEVNCLDRRVGRKSEPSAAEECGQEKDQVISNVHIASHRAAGR